jgi:hypothetical protein
MSVTTEDVQEAVKLLWNEDGTLTGLVTSLIFGRVPDAGVSPYTSFTVADGPVQMSSGAAYLQKFTVEFKTWDEAGAQDAGPIKAAIEALFCTNQPGSATATRLVLTLPSGRTIAILSGIKVPGAMEEDQATRQSKAVKISTDRIEFLCQG